MHMVGHCSPLSKARSAYPESSYSKIDWMPDNACGVSGMTVVNLWGQQWSLGYFHSAGNG